MENLTIELGTVCSGIGSPEVAIEELAEELNFKVNNVFACDIDKYARASYLANFNPDRMFTDMTSPEFHSNAGKCNIFIGGIPCQAFSLAGKRLGESDHRGLLFYDFYKYVDVNRPEVFIIENVKGLLSDNKGITFQNWLWLLGKSENGHEKMFLHEDSLGYNLHYTVLNSKDFGVAQNRERVFIVGIRGDLPNNFRFPKGKKLTKKLKDFLEPFVDEKYYLSDEMVSKFVYTDNNSSYVGYVNQETQGSKVYDENGLMATISAGTHGYANGYIKIKEATKKGFDIAKPGDSINFSNPSSKTRRGRVGNQIANTLDTSCNQAIIEPICVAMRGRNPDNPSDRTTGAKTEQRLEPNSQGLTNTITSVQKDNLILTNEGGGQTHENNFRIRKLTPREGFRLQGFRDEHFDKCREVNSDTQLYKQAGNSMTTKVMKAIIRNIILAVYNI